MRRGRSGVIVGRRSMSPRLVETRPRLTTARGGLSSDGGGRQEIVVAQASGPAQAPLIWWFLQISETREVNSTNADFGIRF